MCNWQDREEGKGKPGLEPGRQQEALTRATLDKNKEKPKRFFYCTGGRTLLGTGRSSMKQSESQDGPELLHQKVQPGVRAEVLESHLGKIQTVLNPGHRMEGAP